MCLASVTVLILAHRVWKAVRRFAFFRSLPQDKSFSFIWGNLQNVSMLMAVNSLHQIRGRGGGGGVASIKTFSIIIIGALIRLIIEEVTIGQQISSQNLKFITVSNISDLT